MPRYEARFQLAIHSVLAACCVAVAGVVPVFGQGAPGAPAAPKPEPIYLHVPDGQVVTHSVRVYVNVDLSLDASPKLLLYGGSAALESSPGGDGRWSPRLVAPGQQWQMIRVAGNTEVATGTLLLFDLSGLDFGFKAMRRLQPVLEWRDRTGVPQRAVGSADVNVGRTNAAAGWTAVIVGVSLLIIVVLSWRHSGSPMLLLTGSDGHLSLAQTQIAMWTVAVGALVVGYGLIRLHIPEIPMSLLVLMGASLATGGLAFFTDAQKVKAAVAATGVAQPARTWRFTDLLRNFTPGQADELSLAKAQMLFWTLLLIVLFISKSILEGAIWTVPWPLVALMGFSQAGYLAPKLT
jgi:hypothetical protein